MLTNVSSNVFSSAKSISIKPMVFAEWNQNIYNPPYATIAGNGTKQTNITTSDTLETITGSLAKSGFTTKKFVFSNTDNKISYAITPSAQSASFKVITYIKTNKAYPIMVNFSAIGSESQYGSYNAEINSFGWTKVETYIGGASSSDYISSFSYDLVFNRFSTEDSLPIDIYFTDPEVYAVTYFDYQYNTCYPTESVFTYFRPGESYVNTGSSLFSFPDEFRWSGSPDMVDAFPVNPITRSPKFFPVSSPVNNHKNGLISDIAQYKYFISDKTNKSITAVYQGNGIISNKLILKFNTTMSIPSINIAINGTNISVGGSETISLEKNPNKEHEGIIEDAGVLVLYWNGSSWTRSRWSTMPTISTSGSITQYTNINKITVTYVSSTLREGFANLRERLVDESLDTTDFDDDTERLQIIEISPRIELDLTPYLIDLSINKSMDNKATPLPLSAINSNDATITFSSIPLGNISQPIPIFSNQSNYSGSMLKNLLNKNVKMYTNFYLEEYADMNSVSTSNTLIPGGIFYADQWSESDANQVSLQCYDITRYLQFAQISDYVSNKERAEDIISNILDLSGFTDYDSQQLFSVCFNQNNPIGLSYYYANSKDTTIIDALNQLFLPYQITAFVDEYGIMRFSSLLDIITPSELDISFDDSNIIDNGYSLVNKAKPGKISIRYQLPKIKQSADLQNLNIGDKSPSYIYTTSNDVIWSQQNADSVGMNYLADDMDNTQNYFELDNNDLLDIFHTYNRNYQGYAAIENEIVSFEYKEYELTSITSKTNPLNPVSALVSIKDDTELEAEISRFNKKYQIGLKTGQALNTKPSASTEVESTGKITKVKRGMFGSKPTNHTVLTGSNASTKDMTCKVLSHADYSTITNGSFDTATNNEFLLTTPTNSKVLLYPTTERNIVNTPSGNDYYKTYSTKIRLTDDAEKCSGGLFFNVPSNLSTFNNSYFVELVKYNTYKVDGITPRDPRKFNYAIVFYQIISNTPSIIAYADVTAQANNIIKNTEKVLEKIISGDEVTYDVKNDPRYEYFNLKAVTYKSSGSITGIGPSGPYTYNDGESESITNILSVFLNNIEIKGWRRYISGEWAPLERNPNTKLPKKVQYTTSITPNTIFGSFISRDPIDISGITYVSGGGQSQSGSIRELYATHKPLKERSVSYYFQSREFLNGVIQGQNLLPTSKTYMMQTKPEVIGIKTYDVQYTTPGAISANVWPIEYLLQYFPGNGPEEQRYLQKKEVGEYSLAYSSILNTGFRGKFAIANNTSHMVYLKKDADQSKQVNVKLNLWTYEIIVKSDQEILEKIIDPGNLAESIQIDSEWIQSKESANKIISTITNGIDYFSKDISLDIFGNPLLQLGDTVEITYPLAGVKEQIYVITSITHSFNEGLDTKLGLTMISPGVAY